MNAITVDTPQGRSGMLTDLGSGQLSFRYAPSAPARRCWKARSKLHFLK